jgi:hypothetical protein
MNEHYVNEEETAQEQLSSPTERHLDFQLFALFLKINKNLLQIIFKCSVIFG